MDKILLISLIVFMGLISIRDLISLEIPDKILLFFSGLHLFMQIIGGQGLLYSLKGAISGFSLYFIIYLVSGYIYKEEAFGLGDVFFLASIGLVLGSKRIILTSIMAFYVALLAIIILWLKGKTLNRNYPLPFAPAISLAAIVVIFMGDKLFVILARILF